MSRIQEGIEDVAGQDDVKNEIRNDALRFFSHHIDSPDQETNGDHEKDLKFQREQFFHGLILCTELSGNHLRGGRTSHDTPVSAFAASADAKTGERLLLPSLTDVDVRVLTEAGGMQRADQGSEAGGTGLILMNVPCEPCDGPAGLWVLCRITPNFSPKH